MCPPFSSAVSFGFFTTLIPLGVIPNMILKDRVHFGWLIFIWPLWFLRFHFLSLLIPSSPSLWLGIDCLTLHVAFSTHSVVAPLLQLKPIPLFHVGTSAPIPFVSACSYRSWLFSTSMWGSIITVPSSCTFSIIQR